MNALPQHAPVVPLRRRVSVDELAICVAALDPGSRALLDLSLRRRLPFEAMAVVLHTDPFDLARRRARAVARIAAELDLEGSGVVATVKAALAKLPDEAWGVPSFQRRAERIEPPEVAPQPVRLQAVQAESMAEAARALMEKLKAQRDAALAEAEQATAEMEALVVEPKPEPADQPTVETEAIKPPEDDGPIEVWPVVAATPMAAAYSHHPAFAIEREDEVTALPPLAQALARAAESERAAAAEREEEPPPVVEDIPADPLPVPEAPARPAQPLAVPRADEREPGRRLARGGILIGLLLALVRLLFGRR
jgi:hypothetical protein